MGAATNKGKGKGKSGRQIGAEGYSAEDVSQLLMCVRTVLPTGAKGWAYVHKLYCETYAASNDRAQRAPDTLKSKFGLLLKHTKPTGDPECPSEVREAHAIHRAILQKVEFATIDDEDEDDTNTIHVNQDQRTQVPVSQTHLTANTSLAARGTKRKPAGGSLPFDLDESDVPESGVDEDEDEQSGDEETPVFPSNDELRVDSIPSSPPPTRFSVSKAASTAAKSQPPKKKKSSKKAPSTSTTRKIDNFQSLGAKISNHLTEATRQRELEASDRVLLMQLESERQEKNYERSERQNLARQVDTLRDQKDAMKEKIFELQMENASLRAQLPSHGRNDQPSFSHAHAFEGHRSMGPRAQPFAHSQAMRFSHPTSRNSFQQVDSFPQGRAYQDAPGYAFQETSGYSSMLSAARDDNDHTRDRVRSASESPNEEQIF